MNSLHYPHSAEYILPCILHNHWHSPPVRSSCLFNFVFSWNKANQNRSSRRSFCLSAEIRESGQGRRRWSSPTNITCFFSPKSKPSWVLGLRKGHQIPGLGRKLWSPFYCRMLGGRYSGRDYRLHLPQGHSHHCSGSQGMAEHVISSFQEESN